MVFNAISTVFKLYLGGQCTYPCFPGVLLASTPHNILPSHWLLSHITIVDTMDGGERGMNPVVMNKSNINPWKKYWLSQGSTQQPPVLKSVALPAELWSSAFHPLKTSCKTLSNIYSIAYKCFQFGHA